MLEGGDLDSIWGRLFVLLSPFRVLLLTYGVFVYPKIHFFDRSLVWITAGIMIAHSIFQGILVGVGCVFIQILLPLFLRLLNERRTATIKIIVVVVFIVFLVFFIVNQYDRAEAFDYSLEDVYDPDSIIMKVFGSRIGAGIVRFISYISHGYKGLNYSLQLPFEWTGGYGGSRALNEYVHQYLHLPSLFEQTYPMRVYNVFGYDCQMSWPTAFAWWASDFSFPGVVILMFFIGKVSCLVLKDAYYYSEMSSIALLCVFCILLIFLPMNNQAFQARDSLITTVVLFILWQMTRHSSRFRCCVSSI